MKFNPGRVKLFGLSLCAMTLLMSGQVLVDAQDETPNTESINYDTLEQVQAEVAVDNSSESEIEVVIEPSVLDAELESELSSDEMISPSEEVDGNKGESSESEVVITSEEPGISDESIEYSDEAESIEEPSYDESESIWEESFGSDESIDYPMDEVEESSDTGFDDIDYEAEEGALPDIPWQHYPHGAGYGYYNEDLKEYYDTKIPIHGYYDRYLETIYQEIFGETIYLPSAELTFGQQEIVQEGEIGYYIVDYIARHDAFTTVIRDHYPVYKEGKAPRDQIILVGHTKQGDSFEIPFETHYVPSSSLNYGERVKVQEGQNSVINTVQYHALDRYTGEIGSIISERSGSEFHQPEIIEVGNIIATVEEVTPFETIYVEDSSLSFGQTQIIQHGRDGVYYFEEYSQLDFWTGELLPYTNSYSYVDEVINEIIAVGNRKEIRQESIDYETRYQSSYDLSFKEKEFVSPGKKGLIRIEEVYSVNPITGELEYVGEDELVIRESVPEVIGIGNVEYIIQEGGHNAQYIQNNDLPYGIREVVQEGISGITEITQYYDVDTVTGELYKGKYHPEIISPAVTHIVHVGTQGIQGVIDPYETTYFSGPDLPYNTIIKVQEGIDGNSLTGQIRQDEIYIVGNVSEEIVVSVPYDIIYRANSELEFGEQKVIQEGVNGRDALVYVRNVNYHTGKYLNNLIDRKPITNAVSMIIEVGNRKIEQTEYDHRTFYIEDLSIPFGSREIIREGENGINETQDSFIINSLTGEIGESIGGKGGAAKWPVDELIAVNPIMQEIEEVLYTTRYISNPTLQYGERNVIQEGQNGQDIQYTKYQLDRLTGELLDVEYTYSESIEAIERIIEVGTFLQERVEIPFEIEYVASEELAYGEQAIAVPGVNIIIETDSIFEVDPVTGEVTNISNDEISTLGNKQIVYVGNRDEYKEDIAFEKIIVESEEALVGEETIIQEGVAGLSRVIVTSSVDPLTGHLTNVATERVILREAINEIIEVGTKVVEQPQNPENNDTEESTETPEDPTVEDEEKSNEETDLDPKQGENESDKDSDKTDDSTVEDEEFEDTSIIDTEVENISGNDKVDLNENIKNKISQEQTKDDEATDYIVIPEDVEVNKQTLLPSTGETSHLSVVAVAFTLISMGIVLVTRRKTKR